MSIIPFPPHEEKSGKVTDAELVATAMGPLPVSTEEIAKAMKTPAYQFAREDGVWEVAILLQTFEDHGPALTDGAAGDICLDMVMDEMERLLNATDPVLAGARFGGFCSALGKYLFDAWQARQEAAAVAAGGE